MRKIEHIEQQISELSQAEFAELREWLMERDWAAWDQKIANDSAAGKLDKLIAEAQAEYTTGSTRQM